MERVKRRNVKGSTKASLGDITLNDFANAAVVGGKGRLKKPACAKYDNINEWEHVEDDEFGGKKIRNKKKSQPESTGGSIVYAKEIWFLISDYIRPENVGTFSAICKNSYYVANSAAFWFNLYKRNYQEVECMPRRLQPDCIKCFYELKQRVIRALYYMYPPFVAKCAYEEYKMLTPLYNREVIKRKCILTWWDSSNDNEVVYYFKLKRIDYVTASKKQSLLELLDDITANQEAGCLVLQITMRKFVVIPPVLGLTLIAVNYNAKIVELIFGSGVVPNSTSVTSVHFNSVQNVNIFHWWSPDYPHSDSSSFPALHY